jgi:cell division protein FtsI (penicillin-binding protein 3)
MIALLLVTAFVSARVVYVHIHQRDFLVKEGEKHYKTNIPLYAYRGNILDRSGHELAVSAPSVSIWVDPKEIPSNMPGLTGLLQEIGVDEYSFRRQLEKAGQTNFMYVKRQVSPDVIKMVKDSGSDFLQFINERKRVYPEAMTFSHVVGITDIDGNGIDGIELVFNEYLQGINGVKSVIRDRLGRSFEVVDVIKEKSNGKDVYLSIDRNIQYIAFTELYKALEYHEANSGTVVVLDVEEGKVLSMASLPAFNPNDRSGINGSNIRNRAITDIFEPGSSVKPFIVAAALEANGVKLGDRIDTSPGHIFIGDKKIKDAKNYGELDVSSVLSKSSNVGIIKIASKVDDGFLLNKLRSYGLASTIGIELPGEVSGSIKSGARWEDSYKSFLSFGYGMTTTALQLANAYAVLANNGLRKEISILRDSHNAVPVRVMPASIAGQIREMLEGVVAAGGTGTRAATKGYRVAGKTGTAKKVKQGVYGDDAYLAIFCGIAPVKEPKIVIAVVIDEPKKHGYYGGVVSAPVFSGIASRVLRYLDMTPDGEIIHAKTQLTAGADLSEKIVNEKAI